MEKWAIYLFFSLFCYLIAAVYSVGGKERLTAAWNATGIVVGLFSIATSLKELLS